MISRDLADVSDLWTEDGKKLIEGKFVLVFKKKEDWKIVESLLSEETCDDKKQWLWIIFERKSYWEFVTPLWVHSKYVLDFGDHLASI